MSELSTLSTRALVHIDSRAFSACECGLRFTDVESTLDYNTVFSEVSYARFCALAFSVIAPFLMQSAIHLTVAHSLVSLNYANIDDVSYEFLSGTKVQFLSPHGFTGDSIFKSFISLSLPFTRIDVYETSIVVTLNPFFLTREIHNHTINLNSFSK